MQDLEVKFQGALVSLAAAGEREASLTAEKEQLGAELEVERGQVAEGRVVVAAQAEEARVLKDQVCVCVCMWRKAGGWRGKGSWGVLWRMEGVVLLSIVALFMCAWVWVWVWCGWGVCGSSTYPSVCFACLAPADQLMWR